MQRRFRNVLRVMSWNCLASRHITPYPNEHNLLYPVEPRMIRYPKIIDEILRHAPDVVFLQECEMFYDILPFMTKAGYIGFFNPTMNDFVGGTYEIRPEGCAIFLKQEYFHIRAIECSHYPDKGNLREGYILIAADWHTGLQHHNTIVFATTQLYRCSIYRKHPSFLRFHERIVIFSEQIQSTEVIIGGSLNFSPEEESTPSTFDELSKTYTCSYCEHYNKLHYTTWKICGNQEDQNEIKEITDYILTGKTSSFRPIGLLSIPNDTSRKRLPYVYFPSHHLSLVVDFEDMNLA
jgi:hypothetical protein